MILPIVVYGDPVLRKVCVNIEKTHTGLEKLIADMFETMYNASGVGLAAPPHVCRLASFAWIASQHTPTIQPTTRHPSYSTL